MCWSVIIIIPSLGLIGRGDASPLRQQRQPPRAHGVWEQGAGLCVTASMAEGHKPAAEGAASQIGRWR